MKPRSRDTRGPFWAIMTDVGIQLVVMLIVLVNVTDAELAVAENDRDSAMEERDEALNVATDARGKAVEAEARAARNEKRASAAEERADASEQLARAATDEAVAARKALTEAEQGSVVLKEEAIAAEMRAKKAEQAARSATELAVKARDALADSEQRTTELVETASSAEKRAAEAEQKAEVTLRRLAEAEQRGAQQEAELKKLRPGGPVDIVILADVTGSLAPHLDRLQASLKTLFRWSARLSSECRIGVLGVRDRVVYRFPLTVIRPEGEDGSQAKLLTFIDSMQTAASPIDHRPAFKEAIAMLPDSGRSGRRQVIITLSDIGQSERDGITGYSAAETAEAQRIVDDVHAWASAGDRSVGCIYVGQGGVTSQHWRWFQDLAYPAGKNFAADSAELFNVIFNAIEGN